MAKKILTIIIFFLISTSSINVYATNLSTELTEEEEAKLSKYDSFSNMVCDIFNFERENGTSNLSDVENLLYELLNTAIDKFNVISDSRLFRYIQSVAIIFLMINFSIRLYDKMSTGLEKEWITKEMITQYSLFILALLVIICIRHFVIFYMRFFRFLLDRAIEIRESQGIGEVLDIKNVINGKRITYEILKQSGLIENSSLIEEVSLRSKEASLRSMYMLPWIVSWVSKVGELIIIFLNTISLLIYSTFYSIALTDIVNDIKKSKFLIYSKYLISLSVQEVVIIVTIYISELIVNPYISSILNGMISGETSISYIAFAIIVTAIDLTKLIMLIFTFSLSKRLMGVV